LSSDALNVSKAVTSIPSNRSNLTSDSRGRRAGAKLSRHRTNEEISSCRSWLRDLEESLPFQGLVVLVVLVDIVVSLFYLSRSSQTQAPLWFEIAILAILWLDIISRIIAHGRNFFFGIGRTMNVFELCVVVFCSLVAYLEQHAGEVVPTGWLRVLGRMARFFRTCVKAHQQKNRLLKAAQREMQTRAFQVLQKVLGDLVKVSEEDLILDPLQGFLRLRDAEVQWENFEELHLPLTVRGGFIGDLQVDIGNVMRASADKEIKVHFSDSVIIFGPIAPDWSTDAVRRRKQNLIDLLSKRLDLLSPIVGESHAGEAQRQHQQQDKPTSQGPQASQSTASLGPSRTSKATRKDKMKDRFLKRLLNHLKVDLSNLSVRYEDINVVQPNPFVCGMALGSLTFGKADIDGLPVTASRSPASTKKMSSQKVKDEPSTPIGGLDTLRHQELEVRQLYVFWDTDGVTSYQGSLDAGCAVDKFRMARLRERLKLAVVGKLEEKFRHCPTKRSLLRGPMFRERFDDHVYVLFPVTAKLTITRRGGPGFEPPSSVEALVQPVQLAVDNRQVESFNRIITHVHDWFRNSSMSCTKPPYGILELRCHLSDADHREHVRWWWRHCVRVIQVKLNMKPGQFGTNFKADLAKPLEDEYLNLMIRDDFGDELKRKLKLFDHDQKRCLDIQVVLPVLTILRLRLSAKRRGPCRGNCGHMVTWHATHCCTECARNPGHHDDTCDRRQVSHPLLRRCKECIRAARPKREEESGRMEDDDILLTVDEEDEDVDGSSEAGQDSPKRRIWGISPSASSTSRSFGYQSDSIEVGHRGDDATDNDVTLHVAIQVESVEVFVMMYSFWGTLFSCVHFKPPSPDSPRTISRRPFAGLERLAPRITRTTSQQQSIPTATTGGFGFERFGIPVCPRVPFLTARAEDLRAAVSLPWRADQGWVHDVAVELSVADVCAKFSGSALDPMNPADDGTSILEVEPFEHLGQRLAAMARLATVVAPAAETGGKVPQAALLKKGKSRGTSTELRKADGGGLVGLGALLRSSRLAGRLRAGSVRAACFMPVVERLLHMLRAGKMPRQVELELALSVKNIRQSSLDEVGHGVLHSVLMKLEDFWQGSLKFDCELAQLDVDLYQRYHMNNILHTTLSLDDLRPQLEFSSQPLQLHVGHLHEVAEETLVADDEVGPVHHSSATAGAARKPTWDTVESDAPEGDVDELQTEIQDASVRRCCCGCVPDNQVFEVPSSVTTHLATSPRRSQIIGIDPGQRPDGLSSRSWWEPLPWKMSFKLVSPTDVGLQVGDASRWPEDFLHLDGQSRNSYGSWFQRDYLHAHLAEYRDNQLGSTSSSPRDLSPRAGLSSNPFMVSTNSLLRWTSDGIQSISKAAAISAGMQSMMRRTSLMPSTSAPSSRFQEVTLARHSDRSYRQ